MVSEKVVGGLIFVVFWIIAIVFTLAMWYPGFEGYSQIAIKLVVWILVVGVSAIAIWLGWVMVSTKPVVPEEANEQPQEQASSDSEKSAEKS